MMIYETSKHVGYIMFLIIKLHTDIVHLAVIQQFIK